MKLLQETSMSSGLREKHIRESNSQLDPTTAPHLEKQHRNASRDTSSQAGRTALASDELDSPCALAFIAFVLRPESCCPFPCFLTFDADNDGNCTRDADCCWIIVACRFFLLPCPLPWRRVNEGRTQHNGNSPKRHGFQSLAMKMTAQHDDWN